jgi:chemotaxis protein methyltransferase CheR
VASPGLMPPSPQGDPDPWSERDFGCVVGFLRHHIGITLEPHRMGLLQARLRSRLQARGLASFTQFFDQALRPDPSGWGSQLLVDLSTVNHTSFFREPAHFVFMTGRVSAWLRDQPTGPIRLWSAGCSSGQEPYSMAMALAEALPPRALPRMDVWGSDLSLEMLKVAAGAIYNARDVQGVSQARLRRFFLLGRGPREGSFRIVPEIRDLVKFRHIDLRNGPWTVPADFHVVFCRNVSIYFSDEERQVLLNRLAQHIRPGGWLVMGNGEILPSVPPMFRKHSPSIYQKED